VPLLFPLVALILLHEVLLGGRVLLPAEYLRGFMPWRQELPASSQAELPQWNVLQWDGMAEFYPWRLHAARSVRAGQVPLWNPLVLCGTPFLANSQSAPLYPPHWLFYLPFGPSTAVWMGWLAFLHLSCAGLFTFLLARHVGARAGAAAVAGVAFELSGFAVAWLELPSFISVSCWIPLMLLLVSRAVQARSWKVATAAGAVLGLMLLAGHLQIALYGLFAAGLVGIWRALESSAAGTRETDFLRAAAFGAWMLLLGLAMGAPQLIPAVELSRMSHRVVVPDAGGYAAYLKLALPPQNWITLLVPDYYGLPARGDFWGYWAYGAPNTMEYSGNTSAAVAVLVVVALILGIRALREIRLWASIAAFSLLLAAGSPLCAALYFGVPGFAQSGSPARVLVLFCLAQAILAGLGLELLLRRANEGWKPVVVALGTGTLVVLVLLLAAHGAALQSLPRLPMNPEPLIGEIAVPALARSGTAAIGGSTLLGLIIWSLRSRPGIPSARMLAAAATLVATGTQLGPATFYNLTALETLAYPPSPTAQVAVGNPGRVATLNHQWDIGAQVPALFPPNASLAYGWADAQGYDSLYLNTFRRLANAIAGGDASPPANGNIVFVRSADSPLFPLLGANMVISLRPLSTPGLNLAPGSSQGPPYIYTDSRGVPPAYIAPSWTLAEDEIALQSLSRRAPHELTSTAFIAPGAAAARSPSSSPASSSPASSSPRPGVSSVSAPVLRRLGPGRLGVRLTADQSGLLVVSEGYAPGWRARIRSARGAERQLPVLRANVAFLGVPLTGGGDGDAVELRYEPASFRVGLFLCAAAFAALAAVAFGGKPAKR
jgi:hypothetical protein